MRYLFVLVCLFCAVSFSGCKQRLHTVEGKVTLDGKPLVSGYIVFYGKGGKGTEGGARIVNGSYNGRVASGKNLVKVQGFFPLAKPKRDPDFPEELITTEKVTIDELHWDNEKLILDMSPAVRDIHFKTDPNAPVEN